MKILKSSMIGVLQLVAACVLVAFVPSPGEAMLNHGPMIKIKFGQGHHGGGGQAAAILAAGVLFKLLHEHIKKIHPKGFNIAGYHMEGVGGGHGHSMGGGYGYDMGGGYGHGMGGGYGHGMGGLGYGMEMDGGGHGYGMGTEWMPMIAGNGMGYSFASHDEHLADYGYKPQAMPWTK